MLSEETSINIMKDEVYMFVSFSLSLFFPLSLSLSLYMDIEISLDTSGYIMLHLDLSCSDMHSLL